MSGIWLNTSMRLLLDKHAEAFPQPEDCRRTSETCKWMEYNYWFSPLVLACVQACMFCRMPGGKQRQTQQYYKGQPDYSFQTPKTLRIIWETTTKHFTDCLFPKTCFYEHGPVSAAIACTVYRTANPYFLSFIITFQGYMFIRIQNWVILATCAGIDSSAKNNAQLPERYANA